MSCSFGNLIRVTVFGQSHSAAIGAVIDGLPAGFPIDFDAVNAFMRRRAPGRNDLSTGRRERDIPQILSGIADGVTCGAPLTAMIENGDARSKDYAKLKDVPRPMHADFAAWQKYGGHNDIRGGGQFSGRLTAPLCFAGAIAMQYLEKLGIHVGAHIAAIGNIEDVSYDPVSLTDEALRAAGTKDFPVNDDAQGKKMQDAIIEARLAEDSLGGIIECAVTGVPAGVGEPIYDSIESRMASLLFGIPAVKGVEFGAGFRAAEMKGSEHNDAFIMKDSTVSTETNRHGGILGGISSGMPILFRAAFKPTPSIGLEQRSVSLSQSENTPLVIGGRHDPCVVPRAVPCVESAAALAILDLYIEWKGRQAWN